jgi:hypothetical protein
VSLRKSLKHSPSKAVLLEHGTDNVGLSTPLALTVSDSTSQVGAGEHGTLGGVEVEWGGKLFCGRESGNVGAMNERGRAAGSVS